MSSKASLDTEGKPLSQAAVKSPKSSLSAKTLAGGNTNAKGHVVDSKAGKLNPEYTKYFLAADFHYELLKGTKCLVCKRTFSSNALLKRHYGIHDGYYSSVCMICGIGFCKTSQMRLHKSKVHKTPKASDLARDLSCERCGGVFDQPYRLRKHSELCISPKNDAVLQCFLCVRTFDTMQQLKGHAWSHLTKCTYCEDKYSVCVRRTEHMLSCPKNPLIKGELSVFTHCYLTLVTQ